MAKLEILEENWHGRLGRVRRIEAPWPGEHSVQERDDGKNFITVFGVKQYAGEQWKLRLVGDRLLLTATFRTRSMPALLVAPDDVGMLVILIPPKYKSIIRVEIIKPPQRSRLALPRGQNDRGKA